MKVGRERDYNYGAKSDYRSSCDDVFLEMTHSIEIESSAEGFLITYPEDASDFFGDESICRVIVQVYGGQAVYLESFMIRNMRIGFGAMAEEEQRLVTTLDLGWKDICLDFVFGEKSNSYSN